MWALINETLESALIRNVPSTAVLCLILEF